MIIYSPLPKNDIYWEEIWLNLIIGFDLQIIEKISMLNFAKILYSPSKDSVKTIPDSIKNILKEKNFFSFKYFEELEEKDYSESLTLVTDSFKIARDYSLITGRSSILYLSYLTEKPVSNNGKVLISTSLSEIESALKGMPNAK